MGKKEDSKPILKRKAGFYQQYRLDQKPSVSGRPLIDFGDEKWKLIQKMLIKIGKIAYYVVVFFLSSVGITAMLNSPIRRILLDSLFG